MDQVMESFQMFLSGNFVALPHFKDVYGVELPNGEMAIESKWQSALFAAGQCGAFLGVFIAGPITTKIGYRWTTIIGLVLMNATIFVSFFVRSGCATKALVPVLTSAARPTRLCFSPSANCWREFRGGSSSPMLLLMRPKSCLWRFVARALVLYRCLGQLEVSWLPASLMPIIRD